MDFVPLAKKIVPTRSLRIRQGKVTLINNDRTVNVTVGDLEGTLPNVKYLSSFPPKIDDQIWFVTDGVDMIGLGHIAAANRTLAPIVTRTTNQSIAHETYTTVSFDTVENDDWNCWDLTPNPTRLTAPITGRFLIHGAVVFAASNSGHRELRFKKNGTEIYSITFQPVSNTVESHITVTTPTVALAKTDYIEMEVWQSSSGALDILGTDVVKPSLSFTYVGP
jgi:hypothetical protein